MKFSPTAGSLSSATWCEEIRIPIEFLIDGRANVGPKSHPRIPSRPYDASLPVIQDAWNYFPHRVLHSRRPAGIMNDLLKPQAPPQGRQCARFQGEEF
jgi:hypothetical protein